MILRHFLFHGVMYFSRLDRKMDVAQMRESVTFLSPNKKVTKEIGLRRR